MSFASVEDPHYQAMLRIIRDARETALAVARVDMPGAEVLAGDCRQFCPPARRGEHWPCTRKSREAGAVQLTWPQSATTIGLQFELHRSPAAGFVPDRCDACWRQRRSSPSPTGSHRRASSTTRSSVCRRNNAAHRATRRSTCRPTCRLAAPTDLRVVAGVGRRPPGLGCAVRTGGRLPRVSARGRPHMSSHSSPRNPCGAVNTPICRLSRIRVCTYVVRAVSRRNKLGSRVRRSGSDGACRGAAGLHRRVAGRAACANCSTTERCPGRCTRGRPCAEDAVDLQHGGYVTIPARRLLRTRAAVDRGVPRAVRPTRHDAGRGELRRVESGRLVHPATGQRVALACGRRRLRRRPAGSRTLDPPGRHLRWTSARLYQDGALVAERAGPFQLSAWPGDLHIGQYSGGPAPAYQVTGQIKDIKIYHRPLSEAEVGDGT